MILSKDFFSVVVVTVLFLFSVLLSNLWRQNGEI